MRIGFLHQYSLRSSGSGRYGVQVVDRLTRRGNFVALVSREEDCHEFPFIDRVVVHDKSGRLLTPIAQLTEERCVAHSLLGGVHGVAYPRVDEPHGVIFAEMTDAQREAYLSYQASHITQIARSHNLDLLHANHEVPMADIARRVSQATGIPYVVLAHGSTIEYVHNIDPRWQDSTIAGLLGAQRVIALNAEGRGRLLEIAPALDPTLEVAPAGVDTALFRPPADEPASRTKIGFIGRIALDKGIHLLLAALPELVDRIPGLNMVVIGGGAALPQMRSLMRALAVADLWAARTSVLAAAGPRDREWIAPVLAHWERLERGPADELRAYQRLCRRAGLDERVTFTGDLSPAQIAARLPDVDALVIPSLVKESFPLVALEALACGVPPIGLDHGGMTSVLNELSNQLGAAGHFLRIKRSPDQVPQLIEAVAAAMRHLADPAARQHARHACRRVALAYYDWDRVTKRLETTYLSVIDGQRGNGAEGPTAPR